MEKIEIGKVIPDNLKALFDKYCNSNDFIKIVSSNDFKLSFYTVKALARQIGKVTSTNKIAVTKLIDLAKHNAKNSIKDGQSSILSLSYYDDV